MIVKAVKPLERETDGADQSRRAILRLRQRITVVLRRQMRVKSLHFISEQRKNGADAVVLLEYDPETGALLQEWQMKRLSWECCAGSVGNGADTSRGIDGSDMADKSDSRFDYYSCALTLGTKTFSYVFQVTWGENVCLYNRIGLTEDAAAHRSA